MNIKHVRALAELMERAGLSLLEITEADRKIRMEKAACTAPAPAAQRTAQPAAEPFERFEDLPKLAGAVDFNSITEVRSPMVGIFYAAPAPGAAPLRGHVIAPHRLVAA